MRLTREFFTFRTEEEAARLIENLQRLQRCTDNPSFVVVDEIVDEPDEGVIVHRVCVVCRHE